MRIGHHRGNSRGDLRGRSGWKLMTGLLSLFCLTIGASLASSLAAAERAPVGSGFQDRVARDRIGVGPFEKNGVPSADAKRNSMASNPTSDSRFGPSEERAAVRAGRPQSMAMLKVDSGSLAGRKKLKRDADCRRPLRPAVRFSAIKAGHRDSRCPAGYVR